MLKCTLYVSDTRYSAPTLMFVAARDEARVREIAAAKLAQSPCHDAVEARMDDTVLFTVRAGAPSLPELTVPPRAAGADERVEEVSL